MKVFIDGRNGTTGLRIVERLSERKDIRLIQLPEADRKNPLKRQEAIFESDVTFLCLPDDAAREAVELAKGSGAVIIDASTAHRVHPDFAYGLPELSASHKQRIASSKKIAVPGCHAGGFVALVYPLIAERILRQDAPITCHSLTGYSGGGKKMIQEYDNASELLKAPRQYGLNQSHKHLKEMKAQTGLDNEPVFCPIVDDFYSGMEVTVPIHRSFLRDGFGLKEIREAYRDLYRGPVIRYAEGADEEGFISAAALSARDSMEISVYGNDDRMILVSRFDNLGKGASGAAIQCMNLATNACETEGLIL